MNKNQPPPGFNTIVAVILLTIILGLGGAGYWHYYAKDEVIAYETVKATKKTITQIVSVTGRVKASESVDLAFTTGGRVVEVPAAIGDRVAVADELVVLDSRSEAALVAERRAALVAAQARQAQYQAAVETSKAELADLLRGTRPEELEVAVAKVARTLASLQAAETALLRAENQVDTSLNNLYDDVIEVVTDAFTHADDAVNKQVDALFTDGATNPRLSFTTGNTQAKIDAENHRRSADGVLLVWKKDMAAVDVDRNELDILLRISEVHLEAVRVFLSALNDAVNEAGSLSQATLTSYKTSVNTARSNINTAIAAVKNQRQAIAAERAASESSIDVAVSSINDARQAKTVAEQELQLLRAGTTEEQITAAKARVDQAEATVSAQAAEILGMRAALQQAEVAQGYLTLRSPLAGVVVRQNAKIGEFVAATEPVISLISDEIFEIEAKVPEADIAFVAIGDEATVTLDAYTNDDIFLVSVSEIDPAETIIDGVVTYTVTLTFDERDERIRSGMTADVEIITDERVAALVVPQRAVVRTEQGEEVQLLLGSTSKMVTVETGIRDSFGQVEIISGLEVGDEVIVGEKKN